MRSRRVRSSASSPAAGCELVSVTQLHGPPWYRPSPTADDIADAVALRQAQARADIQQFTAEKPIELTIPVQPASATFFIGPNQPAATPTPQEGYVWSLKMLSVNLSATGTMNIYKSSSSGDTRRPLCPTQASNTVQSFTWSSDAARIKHGEGIYIMVSTTITGVYLHAWEVPAEKVAKLYD